MTTLVAAHTFWQHFIFYGKIAGAAIPIGTVLVVIHRTLISPMFKRIKQINETIEAFSTNHLPHIQESLNRQDSVLTELKSSVVLSGQKLEHFGEGLNETKKAVADLHGAFITHLENAAAEKPKKRKAKS